MTRGHFVGSATADEVIEWHAFCCSAYVAFWPIATDRILVAERRFRGITDMAGAAAGRTRTRMTQSGHWRALAYRKLWNIRTE
jgi:hypothetical protein